MIGKYVPDAPAPSDVRLRSPLGFAERWSKFSSASTLLLGAAPPTEWFEDEDRGLMMPSDPDSGRHPYTDDDPPTPPFKRQRSR